MDYEKVYKKALERAEGIHSFSSDIAEIKRMEQIFPELAESEDERIRKQIISFLKEFEYDHYRSLDFSSWIAWLEKQGETSPVLSNSLNIGKENEGEISPKWTEEDEENFRDIMGAIHTVAYQTTEDEKARIDWLKSLKQRLGCRQMTPIVQKDIDDLVYNFKWCNESFKNKRITDIYRQGIYDVLELLKQRMQ